MTTATGATSSPPSYAGITHYVFSFLPTPRDSKAHVSFNNIYGGTPMPHHEDLFTDPVAQEQLKPEREVIQIIRERLVEMIVNLCDVGDIASVGPMMQPAALFVMVGNKQSRLNNANLMRALERARLAPRDEIELRVGLHHLYFDSDEDQNYTDWTKIHIQRPATAPAPAPMTAAQIAAAMAQNMPQPMSAADLASALAPLITTAQTAATMGTATATGTGTTTSAPSSTTAGLLHLFNPAALPSDVRVRYERKLRGENIVGSTVTTPYANSSGGTNYYYLHYPDNLVLADGSMFILNRTLEEKAFLKSVCFCTNDTHTGIRSWYNQFVQVCHDYGYYAHPLWCFRKDHGQEWGFTVGDDPDDDLPLRMSLSLQRMKGTVHRVLLRKEMFPSNNSRIKGVLQASQGDGYKALKAIIFNSHPVFYDQPSTLVKNYPRQVSRNKVHSMLEYFELFVDFQQLRAFIMNIDRNLDDANEIDIFINNSKYSEFLNRVTRDERRIASKQYKYTKAQIVETLNKYLMAADSPALKEMVAGGRSKPPNPTAIRPSLSNPAIRRFSSNNQRPRVHHIDADDDDVDEESQAETEQWLLELNSIQVPSDTDSQEAFAEYCAIISAIQKDKQQAYTRPCVVCGGAHTFEGCKLLKDVDFLRAHLIRYCINLKKEEKARDAALQGNGALQRYSNSKQRTPVNFVSDSDALNGDEAVDDATLTDDDSQDFQTGRS